MDAPQKANNPKIPVIKFSCSLKHCCYSIYFLYFWSKAFDFKIKL